MLRRRRRLPASSRIAFLAALAFAGAAAWSVMAQLPGGRDDGATRPVTVVAAARDIAAGTTLVPEDLTTVSVAADLAPAGALMTPDDGVGGYALTPFVAGEPVTGTRLAVAAGPASREVPPDLVSVTLAPDAAPASLGAGDHVDVLATYTTARPYTTAVAEDVRVLGAVGTGGAFGEGAGVTVTLLLDPYVAREVVRADVTAHVSLAVRGYAPAAPAASAAPSLAA